MRLLEGLRNRLPKWSSEQLGAHAEKALQDRGVQDARFDAEDFAVRGAGVTYFLGNALLQVNSVWPWQRPAVVANLLELGDSSSGFSALSWEQAKGRLVPSVRDRFFVQSIHYYDELERRPLRRIPCRDLTDRLCVTLVVALDDCVVLVDGRRLEAWQVSFDFAFDQALENLRARSKTPFQPLVEGRVYQAPWNDGNAAARLLLEEPLRALELRGSPVFVLPARDRLFVTGSDDDDGIAALLRMVEAEAPFPHPLSRIPIVRRWPGFESMQLPEAHPLYPALRRQTLHDWGEIYRVQADLLETLGERRGQTAQLASFLLFEPQSEHSAPASFTAWEAGGPSLLPRVDRLALVDPRRRSDDQVLGMIDWSVAEAELGLECCRTDDYPPRYRVEGLPPEGQLRQLLARRDASAAG